MVAAHTRRCDECGAPDSKRYVVAEGAARRPVDVCSPCASRLTFTEVLDLAARRPKPTRQPAGVRLTTLDAIEASKRPQRKGPRPLRSV